MKKVLLLVLALVAAWWYFDGSRRMSEESIRAHYKEQLAAYDRHDAEALCKTMSDDYQAQSIVFTPDGSKRQTHRRDEACREITRGLDAFRQLSQASAGMLSLRIDMQIGKIDLSPDRKTAVVESVSTMKLGEMLVMRTRSSETLIRRMGRITSRGGESKSWVYGE